MAALDITRFKYYIYLQVTTHSHLLSSDEVDKLSDSLWECGAPEFHSFLLQEFDTELDFTSKVRYVHTDMFVACFAGSLKLWLSRGL